MNSREQSYDCLSEVILATEVGENYYRKIEEVGDGIAPDPIVYRYLTKLMADPFVETDTNKTSDNFMSHSLTDVGFTRRRALTDAMDTQNNLNEQIGTHKQQQRIGQEEGHLTRIAISQINPLFIGQPPGDNYNPKTLHEIQTKQQIVQHNQSATQMQSIHQQNPQQQIIQQQIASSVNVHNIITPQLSLTYQGMKHGSTSGSGTKIGAMLYGPKPYTSSQKPLNSVQTASLYANAAAQQQGMFDQNLSDALNQFFPIQFAGQSNKTQHPTSHIPDHSQFQQKHSPQHTQQLHKSSSSQVSLDARLQTTPSNSGEPDKVQGASTPTTPVSPANSHSSKYSGSIIDLFSDDPNKIGWTSPQQMDQSNYGYYSDPTIVPATVDQLIKNHAKQIEFQTNQSNYDRRQSHPKHLTITTFPLTSSTSAVHNSRTESVTSPNDNPQTPLTLETDIISPRSEISESPSMQASAVQNIIQIKTWH
ncbi:MAG: hypothetical protein EZS28_005715 [Streblomastix strix]|uniref:Uncharacterized protein n=1 Tax=Streblomastix strix TaxID=222440 RepID=A0A5J4WWR9_9EUKA|nr:MAG: hypothetical protein EZS28_005715 [Streblomastix strix]